MTYIPHSVIRALAQLEIEAFAIVTTLPADSARRAELAVIAEAVADMRRSLSADQAASRETAKAA